MRLASFRRLPIIVASAAALLVAGCGDGPTGSKEGVGVSSLRHVAGANVEDTVLAQRAQALVVEVRDETGALRPGITVRFESSVPRDTLRRFERAMYVCNTAVATCGLGGGYPYGNGIGSFSADSTDSRGRAVALLRHGTVAENSWVVVTVPEFGLRDSFPFRTRPGAAARVIATPEDTAIRVGLSVPLKGSVVDRFMNPRATDVVTFTTEAPLTIAGTAVTGASVGRGRVVARSGSAADTMMVSVVPQGRVAGAPFYSRTLTVANFDGTDARRFDLGTSHADGGMRPSWRPDGRIIAAIGDASVGTRLHVVDPATGAMQRFSPSASGLSGEWYPMRSRGDGRVYFNGVTGGSYFELYRLEANGTALASVPLAGSARDRFRPDISPDGTKVAVMTYDGSGALAIRVYDLATGNLIGSGGAGTAPKWSPDGQWIAYGSSYGGAIRVMRPDGSELRVVSTAGYGEWVDWTADGNWLVANLGGDGGRLALVNVVTGQQLPLPAGLSGMAQPAVQR